MAKWVSSNVLDGGPEYIRGLASTPGRVKLHVVKAYAAGDSYATIAGNSCGSADLAQADLVMSSNGLNRVLTIAAKSAALTANSGAAPDNHLAIVDSTGAAALLVTDETANQQLYSGNTFNYPSFTYTLNQPT